MVDNFEFLSPPVNLQPFIKYIWVFEGRASAQAPYYHRALVDGCAQLLFAFRGSFYRLNGDDQQSSRLISALVAQTTSSLTYRLTEDFGLFGVCLYPFTLPALTGLDGRDFIDQYYPPGALLGYGAQTLEKTMAELDRHTDRLSLIQQLFNPYLADRPEPEPQVFEILRQMFHARDADRLNALMRPSGMSRRHFQRQVKRYTGYTPKQLARILRLQLTLSAEPAPALTDLANGADFYDQSHLSKEFRQLAGTTPKTYFTGTKPDSNWRREGKEVAFFQSKANEKT